MMDTKLAIDVATFVHFLAVAAGLGAVIFTDSAMLMCIRAPLSQSLRSKITHAHHVITIALAVLWATGLMLIGEKIGFSPAGWSWKLLAKLGTVTTLTVTAGLMALYALPYMRTLVGRRLIDAPLPRLCGMATLAAMSAAGWLTALLLGSSKILKVGGPEVIVVAVVLHLVAVICANAGAVTVYHRRGV